MVLAVLAAGVVGGLWGLRPGPADAVRSEALQLARRGKFAEAEPLLEAALARDERDAEVVQALALGKYRSGRLVTEVEPLLTRWCELRPEDAEPYRVRLEVWRRQGQDEAAIADARQILTLEPGDHHTRFQLAELLLLSGRLEEAERECRRCRQALPGRRRDLDYLLAQIHHAQGRRGDAERVVAGLLREFPQFAPALTLGAELHLEAGRPAEAVPLLRQALLLDPRGGQRARYHLSQALARLGQEEEARRLAEETARVDAAERLAAAARLQPGNLDLQVRAAAALLDLGRDEDGVRVLQRVLARAPDHAAAHRTLADYHERQGRPEQAARHRREAAGPP